MPDAELRREHGSAFAIGVRGQVIPNLEKLGGRESSRKKEKAEESKEIERNHKARDELG